MKKRKGFLAYTRPIYAHTRTSALEGKKWQFFSSHGIIFLVRCTLDPKNVPSLYVCTSIKVVYVILTASTYIRHNQLSLCEPPFCFPLCLVCALFPPRVSDGSIGMLCKLYTHVSTTCWGGERGSWKKRVERNTI